MKTLIAAGLLIGFGVIANFLATILLNIAGLLGALMAGKPGERSKSRFVFGSLVSAAGQAYVYLAYVAFVVNWTRVAAERQDTMAWVLWPLAFLAVMVPVLLNLLHARLEAQELAFGNPQVEAMHITFLAALLGFALFVFVPAVASAGWGWVPYVN